MALVILISRGQASVQLNTVRQRHTPFSWLSSARRSAARRATNPAPTAVTAGAGADHQRLKPAGEAGEPGQRRDRDPVAAGAGPGPDQHEPATERELAEGLLRDDDHSLAEIAFLTGFAEQSSFTRAFKRWLGATPASYRRERRGR